MKMKKRLLTGAGGTGRSLISTDCHHLSGSHHQHQHVRGSEQEAAHQQLQTTPSQSY